MSLIYPRLDTSGLASVPDTLSSWDSCMDKTWCKWPVIVGIIIGSLIVLSIVWCCARCLCCGLECCCGICSCCNSCCPGPRRRDKGYQPPPPMPHYGYQQPPPMNPYFASGGAGGYRSANVPQTATFESASKTQKVNEDALPAMPSWSNATSRKVEQPHEQEDVEMDKMNRVTSPVSPLEQQQQAMLAKSNDNLNNDRFYGRPSEPQFAPGHDSINATHAQPYHDYSSHQQFSPGPYGSAHAIPATQSNYFAHDNRSASPYSPQEQYYGNQSTGVIPATQGWSQNAGGYGNGGRASPLSYAATDGEFYEDRHQQQSGYSQQAQYPQQSQYPQESSYHQPASYVQPKPYESNVVSPISPPSALTPGGGNFGRKPVGGYLRDV